jgi:predicted DsbA family dithiol-disulfide isomerase
MSDADVCITEFTDPGCPWAFSAEPFRLRLMWLYGDTITWKARMVGLSESVEDHKKKGFTTKRMSEAFARISHDHGMPIDTREKPRLSATLPACRAVVATRLNAPDKARPLLRNLRVRNFSGELLDEPETVTGAARDAGIDQADLGAWTAEEETETELRADMAAAREPMPAARVLDEKLANWSGGRRYTCPSYEVTRASDGVRISIPGFQPFPVYDTLLANLVPDLGRRKQPDGVAEVLRWAAAPLATKEVAVICDISAEEAREQLGRVAEERHVGFDGYWTLKG